MGRGRVLRDTTNIYALQNNYLSSPEIFFADNNKYPTTHSNHHVVTTAEVNPQLPGGYTKKIAESSSAFTLEPSSTYG
jgi:hypothetical protein